MKPRLSIVTGIALLLFGVLAIILAKPIQIAYHKFALEELHREIYDHRSTITNDGLVGYGEGDQFERQVYHCDRLGALGYFFHKQYEMEHLPDTGEVHSAFWKIVMNEFPDNRYVILSYPGNVLEVWDIAANEAAWDALATKHNVPDFEEQFGRRKVGDE